QFRVRAVHFLNTPLVQVNKTQRVAAADPYAGEDNPLEFGAGERPARRGQRLPDLVSKALDFSADQIDAQSREVVGNGRNHVGVTGKKAVLGDQVKIGRTIENH